VLVVADAVASNEPEHAEQSVRWLKDRAATFLASADVLLKFQGGTGTKQAPEAELMPNACINGEWLCDNAPRLWTHSNPSDNKEVLFQVAGANAVTIQRAAQTVKEALAAGTAPSLGDRLQIMQAWADRLLAQKPLLAQLVVREIGKPLRDAEEEIDRAAANIRSTARMASERSQRAHGQRSIFHTSDRSVGTVALVTPWNNPIAIPVGKIAPALVFGNGVVLKPSLPTAHTTTAIIEALFEAGLPKPLLSVVSGNAETAQQLMRHPAIDAVSLTGSSETGAQASTLCAHLQKPFQAELGGNNAAIVMPDADLETVTSLLAKSAYGFAGQRCTATRRVIVVRDDYEVFVEQFVNAIENLVIGDPGDHETEIGPLISREHRVRVNAAVEQALTRSDGRLLCGGKEPPDWRQGSWYQPTLIDNVAPRAPLVLNETFGPVAVIQRASNLTEAIALCNGVPQGLVATLYSEDREVQQDFAERAEAGILRINPDSFEIHPDAPFGGWKASGIGPPEHGVWDAEFYSRAQALYGKIDIVE
jgi:acyl-CoA reductase-like NAD-dependent aldehyde dehydrogenase